MHFDALMFCAYCGDILSRNSEQCCGNCVQNQIPKKNAALEKINQYIHIQDHIFPIGINVGFLYPPFPNQRRDKRTSKQQRDLKLQELLKLVTALRNSKSGAVLVHLVGVCEEESYFGAFDEFADDALNDIIHDGSLFTDVYKKQRLNVHDRFEEFYDFLLLYVVGAPYLTTYKFNTKISLDFCHKDATEVNVRKLFVDRRPLSESFHVLDGVTVATDLLGKTEHNSLQFKSNFLSDSNETDIVNSLFEELKLARYVSAFSKNEHGGSFVFGLTETNIPKPLYRTKGHILQPLRRYQYERLKPMIEQRASEAVLICNYDGQRLELKDIVQVRFIPQEGYQQPAVNDLGVLQISVRSVCGIVFFNKEGPQAYRYDENTRSISKLSLHEWFDQYIGQDMQVD